MEILSLFSVTLFLILLITHTVLCVDTCNPTSCSPTGPIVRFPFRLSHQPRQCGFPGFDLSCNNQSQLIIDLNFAGDFVVTDIDYISQTICFKPDFCPPAIGEFIPFGSPLIAVLLDEYFVLNCSSRSIPGFVPFEEVKCVSTGVNATAVAIPSSYNNGFVTRGLSDSCQNIISAGTIPVGFAWGVPFCETCERRNGTCGYKNVETLETGCSVPSTSGKLYIQLSNLYAHTKACLRNCYLLRVLSMSGSLLQVFQQRPSME